MRLAVFAHFSLACHASIGDNPALSNRGNRAGSWRGRAMREQQGYVAAFRRGSELRSL